MADSETEARTQTDGAALEFAKYSFQPNTNKLDWQCDVSTSLVGFPLKGTLKNNTTASAPGIDSPREPNKTQSKNRVWKHACVVHLDDDHKKKVGGWGGEGRPWEGQDLTKCYESCSESDLNDDEEIGNVGIELVSEQNKLVEEEIEI